MRKDHTQDYMEFVMTPPKQSQAKYEMYKPVVSGMRIVSNDGKQVGLSGVGEVVSNEGGRDWMPIVIIVVSAMALLTVYAVVTKR